MSSSENSDNNLKAYRELLSVLESNFDYLTTAKTDSCLLNSYGRLLSYLRTRSPECIREILREPKKHARRASPKKQTLTDDEIRSLTAEQVRNLVANANVTRRELERVAYIRFSVTKGGLSSLRTRNALVEKLRNSASNEDTHESIARVVSGIGSKHED